MREIGVVPGEREARLLADHLLAEKITTKLVEGKDGWAVWVHDEDRVEQAAAELRAFLKDPTAQRYRESGEAARQVRKAAVAAELKHRKSSHALIDRWEGSPWRRYPLTLAMIATSVAVALLTGIGADKSSPTFRALLFSDFSPTTWEVDGEPIFKLADHGFADILRGQFWRLVTPIFIHFGIMHLFFNMGALRVFGGQIEFRKGTPRFLILVLVSAVGSNVAQYLSTAGEHSLAIFGGMSGVGYALFGYLWVKGYHRPGEGLGVGANSISVMMIWFFLCMTGVVGNVANTAHGAGLIIGLLFGLTPF